MVKEVAACCSHERALSNLMDLAPPPSMPGLLQEGEAGGGGINYDSTTVGCLWVAAQAAVTFRKTHSTETMQNRNQGDFLLGKSECLQPP